MGEEVWLGVALGFVAALAIALLTWAVLDEIEAARERRRPRRRLHSREDSQAATRRLHRPDSIAQAPPLERDGGHAQRLPRPEDMPWRAHDDRPIR